jgi:plastocyanin
MRTGRFSIPLAVLSPLALAAPAMAADTSVNVVDFAFEPKSVQIEPGDTVTWNFAVAGHTTTSDSGQAERWSSGPETNDGGTSFPHTFTTPGRFTYVCLPHRSFMKGTVTVGSDRYKRSSSKFTQSRRGSRVTYRFTLVEAAKVSIKMSGPERRMATRKRLEAGKHSLPIRNLEPGKYAVSATFTDDFDKKSVVRITTVVR